MTWMCIECTEPSGRHPEFQTRTDFFNHQRQSHGQELPIQPEEVMELAQSNPQVKQATKDLTDTLNSIGNLKGRVSALEGKKTK